MTQQLSSTNDREKAFFSIDFLKKWTPFIVLLTLLLIILVWNPVFFSKGNLDTVLILFSFLLMSAIGQTWVIMLGSIDLSVGAMASLSSIIFALTVPQLGFGALFLAVGVGLLGGLLNGIIFTTLKIPSFIATLGTGGIFLSLTYVLSKAASVAITDKQDSIIQLLTGSMFGVPNIIAITLLIWAVAFIFERFTTGGKKLYYVGNSEPTSWLSGIGIKKYKILVFTLSGFTASLTGVLLVSSILNGSPTIGEPYILKSIAVVVIGGTALTGGVGGVGKTVVGALILAILGNGMNIVGVNAYFQDIVTGLVIILACMISLDRRKLSMLK
jgi:ribose transport system permease protein